MSNEPSHEPDANAEEVQDASREGFVSVWIAPGIAEEEIDDYLAEIEDFDPNEENEEALSKFAEEFGLLWYNNEFMEAAFEKAPVAVEQLLKSASFAESFLKDAVAGAKRVGVTTAQAAILLYHVAYEPIHGAASGERFLFVGAFPFVDAGDGE